MIISPIPERGPEANKRMSLAILFKDTAIVFNAIRITMASVRHLKFIFCSNKR